MDCQSSYKPRCSTGDTETFIFIDKYYIPQIEILRSVVPERTKIYPGSSTGAMQAAGLPFFKGQLR